MALYQLFSYIHQQFSINTSQRIQEKASFIEKRIAILQNLDLTEEALETKINCYLEYSIHGVFNALAFNPDLSAVIKSKITRQLANYSFMYKLKIEDICYANTQHNGVRAYYDETQQPKIAVICIGNDNSMYKVLPFADRDELQAILKDIAVQDCFKQFKAGQMDAETLTSNILQLNQTRDRAFEVLLEVVGYNISKILLPLKNEFNLEIQLDKLLRNSRETGKLEETIIRQLELDGMLESYLQTRLNKNSILSEAAQQKLILFCQNNCASDTPRMREII